AHELKVVEVPDQRMHGQRQDPLAAQRARGGGGSGLDLVVVQLDSLRAQLGTELRARAGRGIRHEAEPVTVLPQTANCVGRTRDRLTGYVQYTVDVEKNGSHDRLR